MGKIDKKEPKKRVKETLSVYGFLKMFPDDNTVVKFFEKIIWGDIPKCPYCDNINTIPAPKRKGHSCRDCRKYFTIRNNTIFENSRLSLHEWLYAIYLIQTSRKGISSLQLSKELDITQKSSWYMLYKIRESCMVDNGLFSGKEKNKYSHKKVKGTQERSTKTKKAIIRLRMRGGKVKVKAFSG